MWCVTPAAWYDVGRGVGTVTSLSYLFHNRCDAEQVFEVALEQREGAAAHGGL